MCVHECAVHNLPFGSVDKLFLEVNDFLKTTFYPNLFLMAIIDSILVWKISYSVKVSVLNFSHVFFS